jgi:hypothetical protein
MTAALAIAALVIASALLAWAVFSEWHRPQRALEVEVKWLRRSLSILAAAMLLMAVFQFFWIRWVGEELRIAETWEQQAEERATFGGNPR